MDGSGWSDYGNWISNQPTASVTDASEKQVEQMVMMVELMVMLVEQMVMMVMGIVTMSLHGGKLVFAFVHEFTLNLNFLDQDCVVINVSGGNAGKWQHIGCDKVFPSIRNWVE